MNRNFFLIASSTAILCLVLSSPPIFAQSPTAALTIDPTAVITNDRTTVIVTGTYVCNFQYSAARYAFINLQLLQAQGREAASSYWTRPSYDPPASEPLVCDVGPQTFQASMTIGEHPFHGGKALVTGSIRVDSVDPASDPPAFQGDSASVSMRIQITGGGN